MNLLKRNALFPIAALAAAMFVSACATQQSAESNPAGNAATTHQTAATQNPATQPNPAVEPNKAEQPNAPSKETELEISLPADTLSKASVGTTVTVPITVNSKSSKEIFSYSLAVMFDPKVLQPTEEPVSTTATLSDGFMVASDTKTAGRLGIAAASGNKTIKANGTLINTQFKVIGKSSGKMDLRIEKPVFEDNNGKPLNVNATIKQ